MTLARNSLIAAPDAAAAGVFIWVWLRPLAWNHDLLGVLVVVMLTEFVVIQAGPFLGNIVYGERMGFTPRERRRKALFLGATYLGFAGLAAASFDAWFPFFIFVWLFGAKLSSALLGKRTDATGREREMAFWILSNVIFFAAVFAVMFVPVPMLGVTADGDLYGLHGRYEWANHPYEATAAGFLYFASMALIRFINPRIGADLSDGPAPRPPDTGSHTDIGGQSS
jgi:hypothetical protein